jgi:hypothetical protein
MQKYERKRSITELTSECNRRGWKVDTKKYDQGSDFVRVDFKSGRTSGYMLVNMFNGQFFGWTTKRGVDHIRFNSQLTEHDNEPWFTELLDTVYVGQPEPVTEKHANQ